MKKLKTFLLLLIAILIASAQLFASADTIIYKGDINIDGSINASDALMVLKHAAKIDSVDTLVADVDENNTVNATDALWILKFAAKIVTEFPGGNIINNENTTPEPTASTSPEPTYTPIPDATATPTPVATATPTPSLTPIDSIREYVKTNGSDGQNGEKIYGYSYEDNTITSTISYYPIDDRLAFALNYKELSNSELMFVSLTMDYVKEFDCITYEVGYEYGDLKQNYKAKAPIVPKDITADTEYAFTEISSYNCTDEEKADILSMGKLYIETALSMWDAILSEDMGLNLSDIGFDSYTN